MPVCHGPEPDLRQMGGADPDVFGGWANPVQRTAAEDAENDPRYAVRSAESAGRKRPGQADSV